MSRAKSCEKLASIFKKLNLFNGRRRCLDGKQSGCSDLFRFKKPGLVWMIAFLNFSIKEYSDIDNLIRV